MPELPEVETIRRGLNDLIIGCQIIDVETDSPKQILPSLEIVRKAVLGSTIKKTGRRAKLLQLFLDNGKILVFHLKLTGRLLVRKKEEPKDNWQHVTINLKSHLQCKQISNLKSTTQSSNSKTKTNNLALITHNLELRFCDLRKFGWMKLLSDQKELGKLLSEFGPEPMDDLTLKKFKEILASSGRPVKIILMDQQKISGVGNIYASEALFLAGIDPKRSAKSISENEAEKLFNAIVEVLKKGLKYRGASDQYYLDAKGEKGEYQKHFLVYGRQGKPCPNNCDDKIRRIVIGGRGSFYCPACQK